MSLQLVSGCILDASKGCTLDFTRKDVGSAVMIPLDAVPEVTLFVSYMPPDSAAIAEATDQTLGTQAFVIHVAIIQTSSPSLLLVLCLCTTLIMLGCCLVCSQCTRYCCSQGNTRFAWTQSTRLKKSWVRGVLLAVAWAIAAGASWSLVVMLSSHPRALPWGVIYTSIVVMGLGLVSLIGIGAWALRDPVQYYCPVCKGVASRWIFMGTYLSSFEEPRTIQKAHNRCLRCLYCHNQVVRYRWAPAPSHRPYHKYCWETLRNRLLSDVGQMHQWLQGNRHEEVEMIHLLAAAIRNSNDAAAATLLSVNPDLCTLSVAEEEGCSAVHLAARYGKLPLLTTMLADPTRCSDLHCSKQSNGEWTIRIEGPKEACNDVYVWQHLLTYNRQPLYVGHTHGKYIYYYQPKSEDKEQRDAGWCLSPQLGSGTPDFRLDFTKPAEAMEDAARAPTPARIFPSLTALLLNCWQQKKKAHNTVDSMHSPEGQHRPENELQSAVSVLSMEELGLHWIPHKCSLLREAVVSGDEAILQFVANLYKTQHPECFLWKHQAGPGLWQAYPAHIQSKIAEAFVHGEAQLCIETAEGTAMLDFHVCQQTSSAGVASIRPIIQNVFQYRSLDTQRFCLTSDPEVVSPSEWGTASVVFTPCAPTCLDTHALSKACVHGLVDYGLLLLPSTPPSGLQTSCHGDQESVSSVLQTVVAAVVGNVRSSPPAPLGGRQISIASTCPSDMVRSVTGLGTRLADGLQVPVLAGEEAVIYDVGYRSKVGTLPFCAALPENPLGLRFDLPAVLEMVLNTILKISECERQHYFLDPRHTAALYVYTYELSYAEDGFDQIYAAMNEAIRLHDPPAIDFWRPLIWQIDVALEALPSYKGVLYRGINCQLHQHMYQIGDIVMWSAFSSASVNRLIAEEFASGDDPVTLFFLQSLTAKSIQGISRFPEEGEVLFPRNTCFKIMQALSADSDIGLYYSCIDTISLQECSSDLPKGPYEPPPGYTSVVLQVPQQHYPKVVQCLTHMDEITVESERVVKDTKNGICAKVVMCPKVAVHFDIPYLSPRSGLYSASGIMPRKSNGLRQSLSLVDMPSVRTAGDSCVDMTPLSSFSLQEGSQSVLEASWYHSEPRFRFNPT